MRAPSSWPRRFARRAGARLSGLPDPGDVASYVRDVARSPQRATVVRSSVDALYVAYTLRTRGLPPLLPSPATGSRQPDVALAIDVAQAVDVGMRVVPLASTCLRRSVTLVRELDRLGLEGALHIGVRSTGGAIEGHAWVQVGEVVVNDEPATTAAYAPMAIGDLQSAEMLVPFDT